MNGFMEGFSLGMPALVCRWRLANGTLPLENRHLRALSRRGRHGVPVSANLVAWIKQHLEWTLEDGAREYPEGVLMLVVDVNGRAAMSAGPYEPLTAPTVENLLGRARTSYDEAIATGVAPETLWAVREDTLACGITSDYAAAGATTLICDLARTLGMPVAYDEDLLHLRNAFDVDADELFLVSDEHGVVPATDCSGARAKKFAESYRTLL